MIDGWIIVALSFLYIGALFCVAYWGDRAGEEAILLGWAPLCLRAGPRRLLYILDVLRKRGLGVAKRARFHRGLPGSDCRFCAGGASAAPGDLADQDAKYHLDCRFHRRALRQEPRRGGNRDRRRGCGAPALHRLAAQGGVPVDRAAVRLSVARYRRRQDPAGQSCPF